MRRSTYGESANRHEPLGCGHSLVLPSRVDPLAQREAVSSIAERNGQLPMRVHGKIRTTAHSYLYRNPNASISSLLSEAELCARKRRSQISSSNSSVHTSSPLRVCIRTVFGCAGPSCNSFCTTTVEGEAPDCVSTTTSQRGQCWRVRVSPDYIPLESTVVAMYRPPRSSWRDTDRKKLWADASVSKK